MSAARSLLALLFLVVGLLLPAPGNARSTPAAPSANETAGTQRDVHAGASELANPGLSFDSPLAAGGGGKLALGTRRMNLLNAVENPKLGNLVNQMFRKTARVGDGSTAAAIRHELRTGELLSPSGHFQKGVEMRRALQKMIRGGNLSSGDAQIARELFNDLHRALSGL